MGLFETGASKNKVTSVDWENVRKTNYMATTFDKLGWKVPDTAAVPAEGLRRRGQPARTSRTRPRF